MSSKYHYSIIIPVYCNQSTLKDLLIEIIDKVIKKNQHLNGEIIFVDDGSSDDSYNQLQKLKNGILSKTYTIKSFLKL